MENQHKPQPPLNPFKSIALTISGGGFRASAYGLGCLSYLNQASIGENKLLENVQFIGSASGGTLPAILFSVYKAENQSFKNCYDHLRNQILYGSDIIKEVSGILSDDKKWTTTYPTKKRNLINAFAIAYNEKAFQGLQFGSYWQRRNLSQDFEVCFNSAEMENGRTFRFETKGNNDLFTGNKYLKAKVADDQCIKDIRLGDIMAASSCFPGGFEPMIFPDDFAIDNNHKNRLLGNFVMAQDYDFSNYIPYPHSFALMDGGITDNQAMESLKLADERRKKSGKDSFDLILICDVANYFIDKFEPIDEQKKWWNTLSIQSVVNLHKYAITGVLLSFVSLIGLSYYPLSICPNLLKTWTVSMWVVLSVSSIMTGIYLFGNLRFKGALEGLKFYLGKKAWNNGTKGIIDFILKQPIYKTMEMVKERISSVMRVAMDVQLLQIRRLNYEFAFQKSDWYLRVRAVNIYELSSSNAKVFDRTMNGLVNNTMPNQSFLTPLQIANLTPNTILQSTAEEARKMGTTLWFTDQDVKENKRDIIIATGQFTTCYTLLNYCYQLKNSGHTYAQSAECISFIQNLQTDWNKFKSNPLWMV